MNAKRIYLTIATGIVTLYADAQLVMHTSAVTDSLNTSITVEQPDALTQRIQAGLATEDDERETDSDTEEVSRQGFRVQVFSDNNQRTSQNEARTKEKLINERFPEFATYIVYNSPYWRLKVGDFRTEFDAETAADEIKHAFPEFAREVRIVRDRITINR